MKNTNEVHFKGRVCDTEELTFLNGIKFILWGRKLEQTSDLNEASLIITMQCNMENDQKPINVLFTGDTYLASFKKHSIYIPDFNHNPENNDLHAFFNNFQGKFQNTLNNIGGIIKKGRNAKKITTNYIEKSQTTLQKFLDDFIQKYLTPFCQNYLDEMLAIEHTTFIFEPHHGSMAHNENQISKHTEAQIFVISSCPTGQHNLPKKESIEDKSSNISVKYHPIVYSQDEKPLYAITNTPVYVTGATTDGYVFEIDPQQKKISLLNLIEQKPFWEELYQQKI